MSLTLPAPRLIDPAAVPALRWGILGTGWIADKFVTALQANTNQVVAAVGSRAMPSAQRFTEAHTIGRAHASYTDLVADPEVDVVYVATPHNNHRDDALLAIDAGKHVLVEKPMCLNVAQATVVAERAAAAGVFAMEALWSLFLPRFDVIRQVLESGLLGELVAVQADIGEYFEASHRIYDPALAGGAMMDMATYPVMFSTWVAGAPAEVKAVGTRAPSGVVGRTTMALRTAAGVESALHADIDGATPTRGAIAGRDGLLQLDGPFYQPGPVHVSLRDGREGTYSEPLIAHAGLFYQALHVAQCIGEGRTQSPIRPLQGTFDMLGVMDEVRRQTGDALAGE